MKKLSFLKLFLFAFILNNSIFILSINKTFAQSLDSFAINLTGNALNSTSALNITVGFSGGSAQLGGGVALKANGAVQLLTDVNSTTNTLTIVWTGSITDGNAALTGKLKPGSVAGNPTINIIKVEAAGGRNITNDVIASANLISKEPISTPSPIPTTPTPSPTPNVSPTPEEEEGGPSLTIKAPSSIRLKTRGLNLFKLIVNGTDFTSISKCQISSSDDFLVRIRPNRFMLSPKRNKALFLARISSLGARDIIDDGFSEDIIINAKCKNGAEGEIDVTLQPPP